MKKLVQGAAMALLSIALMAGFASCANDDLGQAPESVETRATITINEGFIPDTYLHMVAGNTYRLNGKVVVPVGKTLVIDAGVNIVGLDKQFATSSSALIVPKGAKIEANGTASSPIVMRPYIAARGQWGGLVILGNAPVNQPQPVYIEGIDIANLPPVLQGVDFSYGGNNPNDDSGHLRYVRVEYAGATIGADNELNSFTFGGVGKGTELDHLQAYMGEDDAFEFFGGTVDAKYLVATGTKDDSFDFDFGYSGRIQFAVSTLLPGQTDFSSNPNGIECDNDAAGSGNTPQTYPVLSNLTVVGLSSANPTLKDGAHFRRNTGFKLVNSILYGYTHGVELQNASANYIFKNNVVHGWTAPYLGFTPDATNTAVIPTTIVLTSPFGNYYNSNALKPTRGAALNGNYYQHADTWFTPTSYKGAVAGGLASSWLSGY